MKPSSSPRWWILAPLAATLAALALGLWPGNAPAAGAPSRAGPAWVELRGTRIVQLEAARGGRSAEQRAEEANRALATALRASADAAVTVSTEGEARLLSLGDVPVLTLGEEDARAAAAPSLDAHAAAVGARLSDAVRIERRRETAAGWVFSISLLVFAGLIAWLVLRRLGTLEIQLEASLARVASPMVRAAFLRAARWFLQGLVVWLWVLFGLSVFPQSRGGAEWLLRLVLGPVADLAVRFGRSIPALIAVAVIGLLASVALRSLDALFSRAAQGELQLPLVRTDRALAIGGLARVAAVLVAILLAAPLVAGGDGNAMGRLGEAALLVLALAAVPLASAGLAGLPLLLGGTLAVGDRVEAGGRTGRLAAFRPFWLLLEEADGAHAAIPYLLLLVRPLRRLPPAGAPGAGAP